MEVSEALRRFRKNFGLKQDDVANALNVTRQVYQPYETGRTLPSVKTILKIAEAFNVSTDYLLGRSDIPVLRPPDSAALVAAIGDAQKILSNALENRSE